MITPRFKNGEWENDISEIRHFRPAYWTIGHVMQTGLVIPHTNEKMEFTSIDQYLVFFENTLVRSSGSPYERAIAERYCDYVRSSKNPNKVPLLIPEFRYGGMDMHHKYRLDFTIINPYTLEKQGFEFSPWSTHGTITGTKNKTQKEINEEAKANFEKEMEKQKAYYREYGVYTLIYTDTGTIFLAMPSRTTKAGTFKDIVHPINQDVRKAFERLIIGAYERAVKKNCSKLELQFSQDTSINIFEQSCDMFEVADG